MRFLTSKPSMNLEDEQPSTDQPSISDLAALGIKVRDFGYNNPLKPIRPYVPPPRFNTSPRPLKRERFGNADSGPSSPKKLKLQLEHTPHSSQQSSDDSEPYVKTPLITPNGSLVIETDPESAQPMLDLQSSLLQLTEVKETASPAGSSSALPIFSAPARSHSPTQRHQLRRPSATSRASFSIQSSHKSASPRRNPRKTAANVPRKEGSLLLS